VKRVIVSALALLMAVMSSHAASASAQPALPLRQVGLQITASGVVWDDEGTVVLQHAGRQRVLAAAPPERVFAPELSSDGRSVALRTSTGLLAGTPPSRLHAVGRSRPVGPGACGGYRVEPAASAPFVVSDGRLILAGTPVCQSQPPHGLLPLFVRPLDGGRWRVLLRIPTTIAPMLAACGHWLAIGIPLGPSSMRVDVIDTRSGRVRYELDLPPADLAIDSNGGLLAAVPTFESTFPIQAPNDANGVGYRLLWASPGGRARQIEPSIIGAPAISGDRVAYLAESSDPEHPKALYVLNLSSGHAREIIAFSAPQRSIFAFSLRGPELAWVQSDTTPLPQGQFTCENGQFEPVGPRHVVIADIDRSALPIPAPPEPAPIESGQEVARCGPLKS
jgi:hypothetical protein